MITSNYKKLQKDILQNDGNAYIAVELKDAGNNTVYGAQYSPLKPENTNKVSTSVDEDGVIIGSDDTAEAESDYWLKSQITSGFSSRVIPHHQKDSSNNHVLKMYVIITNTGESDIVINEIGYSCQTPVLKNPTGSGINIYSARMDIANILIDRTMLETPVTITAGNSATIGYSLKTYEVEIPSASGVSF